MDDSTLNVIASSFIPTPKNIKNSEIKPQIHFTEHSNWYHWPNVNSLSVATF